MSGKLFLALAALTMAALAQAAAADRIYDVEITPGGERYAVLRDVSGQRAFAIYEADDPAAKPTATGIGAVAVEDFEWAGPDHLIYRISAEQGGLDTTEGLKKLTFSRWMSISRLGGEMQTLFGNEKGADYNYLITSAGQLLSSLPEEDDQALFARSYVEVSNNGPSRLKESDDVIEYSLQKANLKNGAVRLSTSGNVKTVDWVVSPAGAVIARIDQLEQSKALEVFAPKDGGKQLTKVGEIPGATLESAEFDFFGADAAKNAIQLAIKDGSGLRLMDFDLATGAMSEAAVGPAAGRLTQIPYDPRVARVRLVYYSDDRERAYHLDEVDRGLQMSLEKALPGAAVAITSKSTDGTRMIVHATYADRGDEFYFFDKPAKRLELVAAN